MGVVEDPVEDGVPEGGVADDIVPVVDGELGGEDGSAAGVAVVKDLEEIVAALACQRSEPPVIEDEEPGLGEPLDELGVGTVGAGEGELVEQSGDAVVARRDAEAAGLVAEGASQVGFSGSRCAGDLGGLGSGLSRPADEARRGPFEVGAVRGGHMARIGGISALPAAADVGRHAPVLVKDLDRGCAEPDLDLPAGKGVGDAVEAAVDLGW